MNAVTGFLTGLGVTMCAVFIALLYLSRPLQVILTELCGKAERARFWAAFSNVTLFLVPLVCALDHRPDGDVKQPAVFSISGQIEFALVGLVVSVVVLGLVLSRYIPRTNPSRAPAGGDSH